MLTGRLPMSALQLFNLEIWGAIWGCCQSQEASIRMIVFMYARLWPGMCITQVLEGLKVRKRSPSYSMVGTIPY